MSEPTAVANYRLIERLGQGAMGTVYRAEREGEEVAIKVLRSDLADDDEIIRRFLRERSVLVSLNSPRLVRIHNLVVDDGVAAIVMELVDGGDLGQYLAQQGRLDPADAALKMSAIFEALAVCHEAGVLHRDVKPENVLLDRDGEPHLADFGIARLADRPGLTAVQGIVGTPFYIAPEVVMGKEPGPACDIYSAGIVLYELVEGVRPHRDANTFALLRQHVEGNIADPQWMPYELAELFKQLVTKDPIGRPTAAAAASSLRAMAERLQSPRGGREIRSDEIGASPNIAAVLEGTIIKGAGSPNTSAEASEQVGRQLADTSVLPSAPIGETIVTSSTPNNAGRLGAGNTDSAGLQSDQTIVRSNGIGGSAQIQGATSTDGDSGVGLTAEVVALGAEVSSGETIIRPRQPTKQSGLSPAETSGSSHAKEEGAVDPPGENNRPQASPLKEHGRTADSRNSKRGLFVGSGVAAGILAIGTILVLGSSQHGSTPAASNTTTTIRATVRTTVSPKTTPAGRHHNPGGSSVVSTKPTSSGNPGTTSTTPIAQSGGATQQPSGTTKSTPPPTGTSHPTPTVTVPQPATTFSISSTYEQKTQGPGCFSSITVSANPGGGSTSNEVANWTIGSTTGSGWSFIAQPFFNGLGKAIPISLTVTLGGVQEGSTQSTSINLPRC